MHNTERKLELLGVTISLIYPDAQNIAKELTRRQKEEFKETYGAGKI